MGDQLVIAATGNALTKAVTAAEVIKLGSQEVVDEYEPLEEGLDNVTETRNLPFLEITLSKTALDSSDKGYQPPIDESLVKEVTAEEEEERRERKKSKGAGKGKSEKGKGKGKSKSNGKGKEE